jgi:hypothetical protein
MRVAAVNDDVAGLEVWDEGIDECVNRGPGLDQQKHFAGTLELRDEFFNAVAADNILAVRARLHEGVDLAGSAVEHGDPETMILHVEDQILPHDGQADESYVTLACLGVHGISKSRDFQIRGKVSRTRRFSVAVRETSASNAHRAL